VRAAVTLIAEMRALGYENLTASLPVFSDADYSYAFRQRQQVLLILNAAKILSTRTRLAPRRLGLKIDL